MNASCRSAPSFRAYSAMLHFDRLTACSSCSHSLMSCLCVVHIIEAPLVEQLELLVKQHLSEPLPDPRLPSTGSQVQQWLFDLEKLKVPVKARFHQQILPRKGPSDVVPDVDAASAVVTFTELLQTAPDVPFSSEMDTFVYICNCIGPVWRTLAKYSPRLQYSLLLDNFSQLSSVSSHAIAKLRPDTRLVELHTHAWRGQAHRSCSCV